MYCYNCGKQVSDIGKYCPFCGSPNNKVRLKDESDRQSYKCISYERTWKYDYSYIVGGFFALIFVDLFGIIVVDDPSIIDNMKWGGIFFLIAMKYLAVSSTIDIAEHKNWNKYFWGFMAFLFSCGLSLIILGLLKPRNNESN